MNVNLFILPVHTHVYTHIHLSVGNKQSGMGMYALPPTTFYLLIYRSRCCCLSRLWLSKTRPGLCKRGVLKMTLPLWGSSLLLKSWSVDIMCKRGEDEMHPLSNLSITLKYKYAVLVFVLISIMILIQVLFSENNCLLLRTKPESHHVNSLPVLFFHWASLFSPQLLIPLWTELFWAVRLTAGVWLVISSTWHLTACRRVILTFSIKAKSLTPSWARVQQLRGFISW